MTTISLAFGMALQYLTVFIPLFYFLDPENVHNLLLGFGLPSLVFTVLNV